GAHGCHEVEALESGADFIAHDGQCETVVIRDMDQHLRDGAKVLGGAEGVLFFRDLFGDFDGVIADGSKTGGDFFGSVVGHEDIVAGGMMGVVKHAPPYSDTDPKAMEVWLDLQRRMSPGEKLA